MPSIPTNQLLVMEIRFHGVIAAGGSNGKNVDNVFHYRRTTISGVPTKTALDTVFQASVAIPLAAMLNARFTQQYNVLRWMNDATDAPTSFTHALVGAIAGDSMTTIDAAYFLLRTGLRGRSYRGSKHFGPMSESDTTAGTDDVFNAGALARMATLAAAIAAPLVDALGFTWNPCILSRIPPAQYRRNPTNVITNDVAQVAVNKRIGSMRHRRVQSQY
jgi:hypothetical protein